MKSLGTILIIEDDLELARSVENALKQTGYSVEIAPSADAGLARVADAPVDLALTALRLPSADEIDKKAGLELIDKLHAIDRRLPIILMTAHHTTEIAIEATQRGAYDYLLKPIDFTRLRELIAQGIASARFVSEHEGQTYYFCCPACKKKFEAEPAKYLTAATA